MNSTVTTFFLCRIKKEKKDLEYKYDVTWLHRQLVCATARAVKKHK